MYHTFHSCFRDHVCYLKENKIFVSLPQIGYTNLLSKRWKIVPIEREDIEYITGGEVHHVLLTTTGNVLVYGDNSRGQLCVETIKNTFIEDPIELPNIKNIITIVCGWYHTACIDVENNLWMFGYNEENYTLGLGHCERVTVPQKIDSLKVKSISCGESHTLCIDMDNRVWGFGNNKYNTISPTSEPHITKPTKIVFFENLIVLESSCGDNFSLCLTENNKIYGYGWNYEGCLGVEDNCTIQSPRLIHFDDESSEIIKIASGNKTSSFIDNDGGLYVLGLRSGFYPNQINYHIPFKIKNIPPVKKVDILNNSMICKMEDGSLWTSIKNSIGVSRMRGLPGFEFMLDEFKSKQKSARK